MSTCEIRVRVCGAFRSFTHALPLALAHPFDIRLHNANTRLQSQAIGLFRTHSQRTHGGKMKKQSLQYHHTECDRHQHRPQPHSSPHSALSQFNFLIIPILYLLLFSFSSLPLLSYSRSTHRSSTSDAVDIPPIPAGIPNEFVVGWLGPVTLPSANAVWFGQPGLIGFRMALEYINRQTTLLPGVTLRGVYNDTRSDIGLISIMARDQILNSHAIGLVGEYQSTSALQVQYVARYYQVPQCAPGQIARGQRRM